MNHLKFIAITTVLFVSCSALAFPKHTFMCVVGVEPVEKSMYIEIEDADVETGLGNITLSDWVIPANVGHRIDLADGGIIDGPAHIYVSPKWVPFQQAQAMMELTWTFNPLTSEKIIIGAKVNMGRSGSIEVSTSGKADNYNSNMTGELKATAMGFNYPNDTEAKCAYFLVTGVKPGLTGSN